MAAILCDMCGGSLSMDASGEFMVCDFCGTKHSKDRIKAKVQEISGTVEVGNIANIESLMKRGNLALEDLDLDKAYKCFDQILDINPEYAPAYVGKLCADISVKKETYLASYCKPLDDMPNYQKAIRFANEIYRTQLERYNSEIKKYIEEQYNIEQKLREEQKNKEHEIKQHQEQEQIKISREQELRERKQIIWLIIGGIIVVLLTLYLL